MKKRETHYPVPRRASKARKNVRSLYTSDAMGHQRLMEFLDATQDQSSMPRGLRILNLKDAIMMMQAKRKQPHVEYYLFLEVLNCC